MSIPLYIYYKLEDDAGIGKIVLKDYDADSESEY